MKTSRLFILLFFLLSVSFGLAACGDPVDPSDPLKPVTPVAQGDYQAVPPTGGTISKDDISLTFPGGSFSTETNVALTEVKKKGSVLGDDEISKFYQVTLPPQVGKPVTVSIKCAEQGRDVNVVAHVPSYCISGGYTTYSDILLKSTYSNGAYTVTLPAMKNDDVDPEAQLSICLGVARMEYVGKGGPTKSPETKADVFDEHYSVGNVSWHFDMTSSFKNIYGDQLNRYWEDINDIIAEAIEILHNLGLKVTTRDIGMSFSKDVSLDGGFTQSAVSNESSTISFKVDFLKDFEVNRVAFSRTVIHELMHDFQADYDPRCCYNKAGGMISGFSLGNRAESPEIQILYESGAVWAEQFMYYGFFPSSFVSKYVPHFIRGFDNLAEIYEGDMDAKNMTLAYRHHGYGAATLLQYITNKMGEYNLSDTSIVSLYNIWNKTNYWLSKDGPKDCFSQWTGSHGRDLFYLEEYYDEFLLSLLEGDLIDDIDVGTLSTGNLVNGVVGGDKMEAGIEGSCFPFGCAINIFRVKVSDKTPLDSKQLVIEQNNENVITYALFHASKTEKCEYKTWKDAPIAIGGGELFNKYHNATAGETNVLIYTVTTPMAEYDKAPYKITVRLKDGPYVEPTELRYGAEGGTQNVKLKNYKGYSYYGATVREEGHGWCGVATAEGPSINVIVQPNNTDKKRECIVDCHVSNLADAKENEKVKMPVRIVQEAGSPGPQGETLNIGVIDFSANIAGKGTTTYNDPDKESAETTPNGGKCDFAFKLTMGDLDVTPEWSATLSGTTISVKAEYGQSFDDYSFTTSISFDITDFSGDYRKTKVKDLVFKYNRSDGRRVEQLSVTTIPDNTYVRTTDTGCWLWFESTGKTGLSVSSLKYYDLAGTIDRNQYYWITDFNTAVNDDANTAKLDFRFTYPRTSVASDQAGSTDVQAFLPAGQ